MLNSFEDTFSFTERRKYKIYHQNSVKESFLLLLIGNAIIFLKLLE